MRWISDRLDMLRMFELLERSREAAREREE
jgi:hypothetical protein